MRYLRNKILGNPASRKLYYLKRVPGHTKLYKTKDVAAETESIGAMSAEDVVHVMGSFVRSLRKILARGDKVKIEGLGTFYTTFNCKGTEEEKDCTVKNIKRVNVRFAVDNTLRLVNDSIATTRGGVNNVEFYIKSDTTTVDNATSPDGEDDDNDENDQDNGDSESGYTDPNA
jgi:predicted histone-like DNA-binding protein